MIFRRYIRYRMTSKGYWASFIEREECWKNRQNIGLELINWRKNRAWNDVQSSGGSLLKYRRYVGYIDEYIKYITYISGKYGRFFWKLFFFKKYLSFFIFLLFIFNLFFILNLHYHFILTTFYIYLINAILKNYYHFIFFIRLILFNFKCFYFKILKI